MTTATQIVGALEREAYVYGTKGVALIVGKYEVRVRIYTRRTSSGTHPVVQFKFGGKVVSRVDLAVNIGRAS